MSVKEWYRQMQPVQLYIILILTVTFCITELVVSHTTHSLTLLMNSYHMLCNVMALAGCIATIKYGKKSDNCDITKADSIASSIGEELCSNPTQEECTDTKKTKSTNSRKNQEMKMKNTFGWARIDIISMLMCFVFMASFSFSIFVEALQTLVHIDHQDEMHHPVTVFCLGCTGLILNGLCYFLIGGYTYHQGSFLHVTESGDVILNKVVVGDSVSKGERRLSRTKHTINPAPPNKPGQGLMEMFRDVFGCVLVIVTALLIYITENKELAKYIDPLVSLVSAGSILIISYPFMKESCLILLQTIPDSINIDTLKQELLKHFPEIVNVHDFHVWQLTANKVISTVHIIFQDPKVYNKIMSDVKDFLLDNGITQVTIQPEFFKSSCAISYESLISNAEPLCLMACQGAGCKDSHCCPNYDIPKIESINGQKLNQRSAPSSLHSSAVNLEAPVSKMTKSEPDLTI